MKICFPATKMNSLGICQCYGVILLLSAVFLSLFICAESGVNTKGEKRHETQVNNNKTTSSGAERCVRAERPTKRAERRAKCHHYSAHAKMPHEKYAKPEVCRLILGNDLLFATPAEQKSYETQFVTYTIRLRDGQTPSMPELPMTKQLLSSFCWRLIMHMYCRFLLPKCDLTSARPRAQPICREACRDFKRRCQSQWNQVQRKYKPVSWSVQRLVLGVERVASGTEINSSLMHCRELPRRKPDIPECYYPEMLLKEKDTSTPTPTPIPITDTCFHGDGQGYRGNVTMTRSGYTCQLWSSQCPHRHHRTPDNFPELKNASNTCRNPGGQAPHGPWCYTTNRTVRWEYCRVDKCEVQKGTKD